MTPVLGPLDGNWSAWGSPLDRKRDTLATVLLARNLPMDEVRIRALAETAVDAELKVLGITVWTPGGFGHVGR